MTSRLEWDNNPLVSTHVLLKGAPPVARPALRTVSLLFAQHTERRDTPPRSTMASPPLMGLVGTRHVPAGQLRQLDTLNSSSTRADARREPATNRSHRFRYFVRDVAYD